MGTLTRKEFIKACRSMGYCDKKLAVEYAKDKETFGTDDFIAIHRLSIDRATKKNKTSILATSIPFVKLKQKEVKE